MRMVYVMLFVFAVVAACQSLTSCSVSKVPSCHPSCHQSSVLFEDNMRVYEQCMERCVNE